jgi:hypothetical protein
LTKPLLSVIIKVQKRKETNEMKNSLYMNKEHGYILTYEEMREEFKELYDGGDPTNCVNWEEYYTKMDSFD